MKNMANQDLLAIIEKIISDFDVIVFAGGADDRKFPNEPAKTFFYNGNVLPCFRLASISKNLKVQKLLINYRKALE